MPLPKRALILFLPLLIASPALAQNTTPHSYMKPTVQSLGNNSEFATQGAKKKPGTQKAKNFVERQKSAHAKKHKTPRWRQEQLARNKKLSKANTGMNE